MIYIITFFIGFSLGCWIQGTYITPGARKKAKKFNLPEEK
jgi:hypothetical protein